MEENAITILTPTYNRAYILNETYKSLCKQTTKNFEWLIIDDGSWDNTEKIVKKFINGKKIKPNINREKYAEIVNNSKYSINKTIK